MATNIQSLTALRGFAALAVLAYHSAALIGGPQLAPMPQSSGPPGGADCPDTIGADEMNDRDDLGPRPVAWRISVVVVGAALLALIVFLYRDHPAVYSWVLGWWSISPSSVPFIDLRFIFSAIECRRLGLDPFLTNPCDFFGRPYNYSPLFLEAARLDVTSQITNWVGVGFGLVMIGAAASLPVPRGLRESAIMALGIFSTMTVLVIQHGNIDIVIFALAVAAGYLVSRGPAARWIGYFLAIAAAACKFYPFVLLLLAMNERPRRFVTVIAAAAALLAFYFVAYRSDFIAAWIAMPPRMTSQELNGLGAINLPRAIANLLGPAIAHYRFLAWITPILTWLLLCMLTAGSAVQALAEARPAERRARLAALPSANQFLLVAGAVLIVACFFAGQANEHRGIFLLPVLAGLGVLGRGEDGRRYRVTAIVIAVLMWRYFLIRCVLAAIHASGLPGAAADNSLGMLWLWSELAWWGVIGMLLGLLLAFAIESPVGQAVLASLRWKPSPAE
jgi:hypothetical protein